MLLLLQSAEAGAGALSGASSLTFAPAGDLSGAASLAGATTFTFSTSATPVGAALLAGSTALTFAPAGILIGTSALAGSSDLIFAPAADLLVAESTGALTGTCTFILMNPAAELTVMGGPPIVLVPHIRPVPLGYSQMLNPMSQSRLRGRAVQQARMLRRYRRGR